VNQVSFTPARRGDTAIDSSFMFKMKFAIRDLGQGASSQFVASYRRLIAKLKLELQAGDYGRALETWELLAPVSAQPMRQELQEIIGKVRALQSGQQPLRQGGSIQENNHWTGTLFRKRFGIVVTSGTVSEIKLRCAQQYLFFKYEPNVQYSIGSKDDRCGIEVVGDPGTTFDLMQ
jgi:hypothetical protein